MKKRLRAATKKELLRICCHLGIKENSSIEAIQIAYVNAADNSIFSTLRGIIHSDAPTYSKTLRLIYREMQSFTETLDASWKMVRTIQFWKFRDPIEAMTDNELEARILQIYSAGYKDAKNKLVADPSFWKKVVGMMPSIGSAVGSIAVTATSQTTFRLPFAAAAPGAVAGPLGLGLTVLLLGKQLAGPSYRKIIPATVELMLIGKRIECMPKE